jgi:carbon storage regulator
MLVLSRKEGEKLIVGENITIVVSKISGNRVTLGIEAPRDVKVVRGELDRDLKPSENQVFHLRLKIDNEMVALQKDVG